MLYKRQISEPAKLLLASREGTLIHLGADVLLTIACKFVTLNSLRIGKPYHMLSKITRIVLSLSFLIPFILTTNVLQESIILLSVLIYVGISVFDVWEQCLVFFFPAAIR